MYFKIYHLVSQTVLHCGAGQSIGTVDQPIMREKSTHLPIAPSASIRGVMKQFFSQQAAQNAQLTQTLFGDHQQAGTLSLTDAHLLLLPVRSVYGVLAYATCPFILQRYQADQPALAALRIPMTGAEQAFVTSANQNSAPNQTEKTIVLDLLDIQAQADDATERWASTIAESIYPDDTESRAYLHDRIIVLPDNLFMFLTQTAMDIRSRIRINQETGVVAEGALWTEENLPAESVLWGGYAIQERDGQTGSEASFQGVMQTSPLIQLGGNASTGSGLVRMLLAKEI